MSGRTEDVPSYVNPTDAEELHNLIVNLPKSRKRYLKALTSSIVGSLPLEFLGNATQLFKLHTNLIMAALRERGCDEQSVEAAVFGAIPLLLAIQSETGRRLLVEADRVDSDLECAHTETTGFRTRYLQQYFEAADLTRRLQIPPTDPPITSHSIPFPYGEEPYQVYMVSGRTRDEFLRGMFDPTSESDHSMQNEVEKTAVQMSTITVPKDNRTPVPADNRHGTPPRKFRRRTKKPVTRYDPSSDQPDNLA